MMTVDRPLTPELVELDFPAVCELKTGAGQPRPCPAPATVSAKVHSGCRHWRGDLALLCASHRLQLAANRVTCSRDGAPLWITDVMPL